LNLGYLAGKPGKTAAPACLGGALIHRIAVQLSFGNYSVRRKSLFKQLRKAYRVLQATLEP